MRKIEGKIIDTIKELNGTEKTVYLSNRDALRSHDDIVNVYLWGNKIASVEFFRNKPINIRFNFCGYLTVTTKSRINAILSLLPFTVKCTVKKGCLYCAMDAENCAIDADKTYVVGVDHTLFAL